MLVRRTDQMKPGIANERGTRIAYKRHVETGAQLRDNRFADLALVVLVKCAHFGLDSESIQQSRAVTRVFGKDDVHRAKHLDGAAGNVVQIAYRRGDDKQTSRLF